jgi:serine/threonine-protein kinase
MADPEDESGEARTVFQPGAPVRPAAPPEDSAAEQAWFSGAEEALQVDAPPLQPVPPPEGPPASWDDVPPAPPQQPYTPPPQPAPPPGGTAWGAPPGGTNWGGGPPPHGAPPQAPPAGTAWGSSGQPPAPAGSGGRIAVGAVLNGIYEVRRFIARGGMGEVYEGVNVNTDERVAIKVILSHLAEDPNVQAMFRKEARTLTRLSHPALVQYRVLAQEPNYRAFYIVTEYIDGLELADSIGVLKPSAVELEQLTRRLASGLAAAHELGAIHRDIAPDNVLLPGGVLDQAKIIDFGIAKDLDPSNKTIVGDGFAGKLGFVAPEQFGDYNREVGPWTDIYSLALVILSLAAGRNVDMGSTLVEAIDKRRQGPDLSPLPEPLRPVFARMLAPNPADRFRSMAEVLAALDQIEKGGALGPVPAPTHATAAPKAAGAKKGGINPLLIGGAAAALVAVAGAAFFLMRPQAPAPGQSAGAGGAVADPAAAVASASGGVRPSEQVRRAVEAALPSISCTWLDIDDANDGSGGVSLRLSGVAGSPVEAQQAVAQAARSTGVPVGLVDTSNVFPVGQQTCAPLDTFRAFRVATSEQGRRFVSEQSNWELMATNEPCPAAAAKAVVNMRVGDPQKNFALVGMEGSGSLQTIFKDRATFDAYRAAVPDFVTETGADSYRSTVCNTETGLVGQLLITGAAPFALNLPDAQETSEGRAVDSAWLQRFSELARSNGWRTEMVWYRVVDDTPG